MKKNIKIFSAIQPTGNLTIGHYLGILRFWKNLQYKYFCLYCIADLHALTIYNKNNKINNQILDLLAFILAVGINPSRSILFLQSDVIEHLKLYWILNCYTYIGELNRMTQYKSKSEIYLNNLSLFSYPVLMASDILLYDIDFVCIGKDQIQHIELIRKISKRFNKLYKTNCFKIPNYILDENFSKILSLIDINKKMSKSDVNINNVIFLFDSPEIIKYKIYNSLTDNDIPPKIIFDVDNKPGVSNLLNILSGITDVSIKNLEKYFINYNYNKFKNIFYKILSKFLLKLQKKFWYFRNKEEFLIKILNIGKVKSKFLAKKKIFNIYKLLNFK